MRGMISVVEKMFLLDGLNRRFVRTSRKLLTCFQSNLLDVRGYITGTKRSECTYYSALTNSQWLHVRFCIDLKILQITCKALNCLPPTVYNGLLDPVSTHSICLLRCMNGVMVVIVTSQLVNKRD